MTGTFMSREMSEQTAVLAELVARRDDTIRRVRERGPAALAGVLLLARGSSDNAALHGRYLLELATGRVAALAAPSLWTRYGVSTDLTGWLVIAVSQSGRTPEIVTCLDRMRSAGACTVAVTNTETSELSDVAHASVALHAGPERAVPATKTVTASVLALAHVATAVGDVSWTADDERRAVESVQGVLSDAVPVEEALDLLGDRDLVHLGRGFTLPVALEGALKAKETTTTGSRGYASGDFLHGPVAAVGRGTAVVGYAAAGPTRDDVHEAVHVAVSRGAVAALVTDSPGGALESERLRAVPVPAGLPEPLVALPMMARAQQLALSATLRAGLDPDLPPGLAKVTITR